MDFVVIFSHNLNFNNGNNGSIGEQFTEIYIKKDSNVQLIIDLLVIFFYKRLNQDINPLLQWRSITGGIRIQNPSSSYRASHSFAHESTS